MLPPTIDRAEAHPHRRPCERNAALTPSPIDPLSALMISIRDFVDATASGRESTPARNVMSPSGISRANAALQLTFSTAHAPAVGARTAASEPTPPQMPITRPRRSDGNNGSTIANALDVRKAPPAPCKMRAPIRSAGFGAATVARAPNVKSPTPNKYVGLRPRESLIRPLTSSRLASAAR